jgi:hypothetical protein
MLCNINLTRWRNQAGQQAYFYAYFCFNRYRAGSGMPAVCRWRDSICRTCCYCRYQTVGGNFCDFRIARRPFLPLGYLRRRERQ